MGVPFDAVKWANPPFADIPLSPIFNVFPESVIKESRKGLFLSNYFQKGTIISTKKLVEILRNILYYAAQFQ